VTPASKSHVLRSVRKPANPGIAYMARRSCCKVQRTVARKLQLIVFVEFAGNEKLRTWGIQLGQESNPGE